MLFLIYFQHLSDVSYFKRLLNKTVENPPSNVSKEMDQFLTSHQLVLSDALAEWVY